MSPRDRGVPPAFKRPADMASAFAGGAPKGSGDAAQPSKKGPLEKDTANGGAAGGERMQCSEDATTNPSA